MFTTLYYRKDCIKSRFLRITLKVMGWEVRELDAANPEAEAEMILLKTKFGLGTTAQAPAIFNNDVYSHELYPMMEYLSERTPEGLFPAAIPLRLVTRTLTRRILFELTPIWTEYVASGDPQPILNYFDNDIRIFTNLLENRINWRVVEQLPIYSEIAFLCLYIEVNYHRPIRNPLMNLWFQELTEKYQNLRPILAEPQAGYV